MSCCPCRKNSRKKIATDKEWSCTCDYHKTPYHVEQLAIIRRSAERGRKHAVLKKQTHFADLFQHILDELSRTNL